MAGVAGRKTQAAVRHSSRALMDDVYTDEESLEVAQAVEMAMPSLPLEIDTHGLPSVGLGERGSRNWREIAKTHRKTDNHSRKGRPHLSLPH